MAVIKVTKWGHERMANAHDMYATRNKQAPCWGDARTPYSGRKGIRTMKGLMLSMFALLICGLLMAQFYAYAGLILKGVQ